MDFKRPDDHSYDEVICRKNNFVNIFWSLSKHFEEVLNFQNY